MKNRSSLHRLFSPLLSLGMLAASLVPAAAAHAQDRFAFGALTDQCFATAADAMTPYDSSIQLDQYRATHGRVYHQTGKTGEILLYGPVRPWNFGGDGVFFSATYIDPDGAGTAAQVVAELRHVGPNGIKVIATLDSNTQPASPASRVMTKGLKWSELSEDYGYYTVRVYVRRANTTIAPAAFGYNLCNGVF
jgi:hypothetical protein